jgi:hypothetical protein
MTASPSIAVADLERRISNWLSVRDGIVTVVAERSGKFALLHALPSTTPWVVTCSADGIEVKFGHWFEIYGGTNGGSDSNSLVSKQLTGARLTEEECRPLVSGVGQKMLAMLGKS